MPELPEVETVRKGLESLIAGHVIKKVNVRCPRLRYPMSVDFESCLTNARILQIQRRAKYLLISLSTLQTWVIHLGMSGRFLTMKDDQHLGTHDHVIITTDQGTCLVYRDPRRFGLMTVIPTLIVLEHRLFVALGAEPLDPQLTAADLHTMLLKTRRPIKTALMDQAFIVGVGNIYACESLWYAKISPFRLANTLNVQQVENLLQNVRMVLEKAIQAGGSTLRDHGQVNGELGYFQHQFRAYDQVGKPCQHPACQNTIVRVVQGGRSTFYCPKCQK